MGTLAKSGSIAAACLFFCSVAAHAFDPHEHKKAGDEGSAEAFRSFAGTVAQLPWKHPQEGRYAKTFEPRDPVFAAQGQGPVTGVLVWVGDARRGEWFTFGDLVAIYGDFRESMEELFRNPNGATLKRITRTGECCGLPHVKNPPQPEGVRFFQLAGYNATHFHRAALDAYVRSHLRALQHVAEAVRRRDQRWLWRALHHEAMALHSLTDLFAGGHLLIDRGASVARARSRPLSDILRRLPAYPRHVVLSLNSAADGALHQALNAMGLEVRSAERPVPGSAWYRAFGDAEAHKSPVLQAALKGAVARSLRTLLQAYVDFERNRNRIEAHYRDLLRGRIFDALKLLPADYRAVCAPDLQGTSFARTMSDLLKNLPWLARRAVEPVFRSGLRALSKTCFAGGASPLRSQIQALLSGRAAVDPRLVASNPR